MSDKRDYAVGYGKPPLHSRFQKGQSGNPKGRPRGSTDLARALEKELRSLVTVKEHGRTKTITKLEAASKQLVNKAAGGDHRALQMLIAFVTTYLSAPEGVAPVLAQEADQAVLAGLLKRFGPSTPEPSASPTSTPSPSPKGDKP